MKNKRTKFWKSLQQADDWFLHRMLRLPKQDTQWLKDDLRWIQKTLPWLARAIAASIICFIVGWVIYWLFWIGPKNQLSNPKLQYEVPTAFPIQPTRELSDAWISQDWLSQTDARMLSSQENTINLAYLKDNGSVLYSPQSIVFDPQEWQKFAKSSNPGLHSVTVQGTTILLQVNGQYFHLNIYQPFVFDSKPDMVYLTDSTGQIWSVEISTVDLVPVKQAINSLPVIVNPNPNLTPTY